MPPTQEQDWVGYFEIQEPSLSLSHPPNLQGLNVHIRNVFAEGDLTPESVVKDFFTTAADGKKYKVNHYNLDAVIAVGYRISSKKATQFRIWATWILREYLTKGYNLNHHKLGKDTEALIGLYDAVSMVESGDIPGKLKGKITIKLTKYFEPREK